MPKTLLLADDSVTIQKVVALSFANEDIRLISVDNGDDALSQAREHRPDAVLADVVMPGLNGYELCEALQADPNLRPIPVLLLTGTFEAFDEERARRCGAAGQVAKPFEAQSLLERVRELLARPPAAPASAPEAPAAAPLEAEPDTDADAFDFFADEAGDLSPQAPNDPAADSLRADPDDAFSFGEDDFSDLGASDPGASGTALEFADEHLRPEPGAAPAAHGLDATVAILPDEAETPDAPLLTATPVDGFGDEGFGDPEFATLASELVDGDDADDAMDLLAPEPNELPALRTPRSAPAAEPAPEPEPARAPEPTDAPQPSLAPEAALPPELEPEPLALAREPLAFPSDDDSLLRVDTGDLAQASVLDPGGAESFDVSSSDLEETGRALPPAPAPPTAVAGTAGLDIDAIAPQLRAQVHDTLEKVAWESFGGLTEEIVRQVVERVEAIAWEVVPQMAETVIRETIRQMQQTDGDEPPY